MDTVDIPLESRITSGPLLELGIDRDSISVSRRGFTAFSFRAPENLSDTLVLKVDGLRFSLDARYEQNQVRSSVFDLASHYLQEQNAFLVHANFSKGTNGEDIISGDCYTYRQ